MMERALRLTIDYVKERQAFGKKIAEFQNTQFTLAECKTEATVARVFVNHCIGVVDYWAGSFIAGQRIPRDRDSEFTATGRVDELLERLTALQQRLPGCVEIAVTEGIRDRSVADGVRGGIKNFAKMGRRATIRQAAFLCADAASLPLANFRGAEP